jgi:hypothetical protein
MMSSAAHSYLGEGMENVHQRTFFEYGNEINIPVIYLDEIIVFPVYFSTIISSCIIFY